MSRPAALAPTPWHWPSFPCTEMTDRPTAVLMALWDRLGLAVRASVLAAMLVTDRGWGRRRVTAETLARIVTATILGATVVLPVATASIGLPDRPSAPEEGPPDELREPPLLRAEPGPIKRRPDPRPPMPSSLRTGPS